MINSPRLPLVLVAVAGVSWWAVPAHAGLALPAPAPQSQSFTGSLPDELGGSEATAWIQANQFDLTAPTILGNVLFWDLESPDAYQGSITWDIYSDAVGSPGSVVASGSTFDVARTATGYSGNGLTEFEDSFSIGSVALGTGDYWLGLHNGPMTVTTDDGFYWEDSARTPGIDLGQEDYLGSPGPFLSNGEAHAFVISPAGPSLTPLSLRGGFISVPEPSAAACVGIGLVPLALAARRRAAATN